MTEAVREIMKENDYCDETPLLRSKLVPLVHTSKVLVSKGLFEMLHVIVIDAGYVRKHDQLKGDKPQDRCFHLMQKLQNVAGFTYGKLLELIQEAEVQNARTF